MARQELETMTLAVFHNELQLAMTSYYEGILKMPQQGVLQAPNQAHCRRWRGRPRTAANEAVAAPDVPDAAAAAPAPLWTPRPKLWFLL